MDIAIFTISMKGFYFKNWRYVFFVNYKSQKIKIDEKKIIQRKTLFSDVVN